ncbi:MAG: hypothetical protein M3R55_16775 [Acidobacteriota bacterium]|nr:hypothetical protein [Acidobacteriota bacterium]
MLPLVAVCLALVLSGPPAEAQSQDLDSLRRRVEEVERQMFQQRLNTPLTSPDPSVALLQQRLDRLEREISSQRISDIAADVTSKGATGLSPQAPGTRTAALAAKVEALEDARAADAKIIEKLTARLEALEKAARPPARRKQ